MKAFKLTHKKNGTYIVLAKHIDFDACKKHGTITTPTNVPEFNIASRAW